MEKKPVMLVADDVEINRAILTQFFKNDYFILEAASGEETLATVAAHAVDVILLDLVMPGMDSFDEAQWAVCRYSRHRDDGPQRARGGSARHGDGGGGFYHEALRPDDRAMPCEKCHGAHGERMAKARTGGAREADPRDAPLH